MNQLLSPYVDAALTRAGISHVEWNLLILSVEDEISEETRWLRTKFGFTKEVESRVRVASDVAQISIIWSPVMQFSGSLDSLGALIFIYEGACQPKDRTKPSAQALLHEVVRQISLQSRYRHPVLIINFNETLTNASEVWPSNSLLILKGSTRPGFTDPVAEYHICSGVSSVDNWWPWRSRYGRIDSVIL